MVMYCKIITHTLFSQILFKSWTLNWTVDLDYGLDWIMDCTGLDKTQLYTDSNCHQNYNRLSLSLSKVVSQPMLAHQGVPPEVNGHVDI